MCGLPGGPVDVTRHLDVLDGQVLVDLLAVQALTGELLDLILIVVGAEDGLLEDGWVGRVAAQRVLVDEALELPTGDQGAPEVVQPGADAGLNQRLEVRVDVGGFSCAHRAELLCWMTGPPPRCRRTAATTQNRRISPQANDVCVKSNPPAPALHAGRTVSRRARRSARI